ncbi:MAG TPA: YceI family protein [Cyclobacteriaceae bacterium]
MKRFLFGFSLLILSISADAQKLRSEKGSITFFSDGAIEDITATNTAAGSMLNAATGELVFIVPILEFRFSNSLMREHFNEKYMETEKYPKSSFTGKLIGFDAAKTGEQNVKAIGKLTMHGVSKDVEIPGTVEFASGKATVKSKFVVKLADYNIKIPTIVFQNIAEKVELKIDFTYKTI